MKKTPKYNYIPYYIKTIDDNKINKIGFKPVRGATGLGKTYGLIHAVKESSKKDETLKFIYTTNRHALIKEVKNNLEKEGIKCIYLRSDKEVLLDLLIEEGEKSLEFILFNLVETGFFNYHHIYKNDNVIRKHITKTIKTINEIKQFNNKEGRDNDEEVKSFLDDKVVSLARLIKNQIYLHKEKVGKKAHQELLKNSNIWKLFPYIEFENNPKATVLVATIQKLSYGFFDGHRKRKLPSLKKNIIFLDEFDFLESEILNVLVQEKSLKNPLEFVKIFYDRYRVLEKTEFMNKESLSKIKDELDKAYKDLKDYIKEKNIQFPKLTDFSYSDAKYASSKLVLFQNRNTIFSQSFYLKQTNLYWEIRKWNDKNVIQPLHLFVAIKKCIKQLLDTFSRTMQEQKEEVDYIIEKIWNVKNDNEQGQNQNYITNTSLFKNIQVPKAEVNENDFDYLYGFNVIKLSKNDKFDPLDAKLEQMEIPTSPEAIIRKLSYENLVFALSATSDIPRVVNCFDEEWLKKNTPFIEPSTDDKKLLLDMKKEKDDIRKTNVEFHQNKVIKKTNQVVQVLENINNRTDFFDNKENSVADNVKDYRLKRVKEIVGCVDWILNESKNRSHLVFLTTFKHFEWLLDNDNTEVLEDTYRRCLLACWNVEKMQDVDKKIKTFKLEWKGKTCMIIFLNAKSAKQIEEEGKEFYNQRMSDNKVDKVILITQYATASNGVNLGFEDKKGIKRDFESIHLLEPKHFWITNKNDLEAEKEKFWYLWKIHRKGELSKARFKHFLGNSDGNSINNEYKRTYEYTLNAMALFHQALGRVERQRSYEQPLIEITLSIDVMRIFKNFLSLEYQDIEEIKEKLPYTATTITQLYDELKEHLHIEEAKLMIAETQNITTENKKSKEVIDLILDELQKIKKGKYNQNEELANEIILIWKFIRDAVLKQDYTAEIKVTKPLQKILKLDNDIFEFSAYFTFSTSYFQEDNEIILSVPTEEQNGYEVYKEPNSSLSNVKNWNLDFPYSQIKQNAILRNHFEEKNYPTSFQRNERHKEQFVFTPRVEQAILKGALGEEAIWTLLEKQGIYLEDLDEGNKVLFEMADMKTQQLPIYIDAKNFSHFTTTSFALYNREYEFDGTYSPDKVIKKAQTKIKKIQRITEEKTAKFVFINFYSTGFQNVYYNINLKQVSSFEKCSIAVISSALDTTNLNQLDRGFLQFTQSVLPLLKNIDNSL